MKWGPQVVLSAWSSFSSGRKCVECRYEEAFHKVLGLEDVGMVSWLCQQLDPGSVLSQSPPRLSQHLLLSLIQQLGHDLHKVCAWPHNLLVACNMLVE